MAVGERIPCFWITPTGVGRMMLRRYRMIRDGVVACAPGEEWHDATVYAPGEIPIVRTIDGYLSDTAIESLPLDDPRWPSKCDHCAYEFAPTDLYAMGQQEQWVRSDNHEPVCWNLMNAPAGAMYDAFWMNDSSNWIAHRYPDGIVLTVVLPDKTGWVVDGHTSPDPSGSWTRTGDPRAIPPTVTATPSILTQGYHGFLTDGHLIEV